MGAKYQNRIRITMERKIFAYANNNWRKICKWGGKVAEVGWREIENCINGAVKWALKAFSLGRVECPLSWPRVFGPFVSVSYQHEWQHPTIYACWYTRNPLGSVPKSIIILWAVGVAFNNYITTVMSRPLEWDTAKLLNIRVGKGSLVWVIDLIIR